jgi:hypothetical protein
MHDDRVRNSLWKYHTNGSQISNSMLLKFIQISQNEEENKGYNNSRTSLNHEIVQTDRTTLSMAVH